MKIWAIVLFVLGGLNFIIGLIGLGTHPQYAQQQASQIVWGLGFIGGGIYLLDRAAKKKKEQEDKEKWINGEK